MQELGHGLIFLCVSPCRICRMKGSRQLQAALQQGSTWPMGVQQSCRANSSTVKLPTRYFFMEGTSSAMGLMWLVSEGASWSAWRQAPAPLSQ